jgi:predicted TIM-barrel fold metal-dependent hydrolase
VVILPGGSSEVKRTIIFIASHETLSRPRIINQAVWLDTVKWSTVNAQAMIIDSHVHIWMREHLPDSMVRAYLEPLNALKDLFDWEVDAEEVWPEYGVDVNKVLEMMSAGKVDRAVVLPIDYNLVDQARVDIEQYNIWAFEGAAPYRDRIIPFVGIDPQRGDRAISIMEKFVKKYDAPGIKVYPATGWYPNEERVQRFWEHADDLGLVVITHGGAAWGPLDEKYTRPSFYDEVLHRYPDLRVVIAHIGGKYRSETYELCAKHSNCFTDISALQGWLPSDPDTCMSRLKEVAEKVPDRASFGTDFPLFDLSYPSEMWLNFVRDRPWADEDTKAKVLGGNMRRLLGL